MSESYSHDKRSSNHLYHMEHRFQVTHENLATLRALLVPSGKFVWIGRQRRPNSQRLQIGTLPGVDGMHCDVALPTASRAEAGEVYVDQHSRTGEVLLEAPWMLVGEIALKDGCYDGHRRWRIGVRDLQPTRGVESPPMGKIVVEECGNQLAVLAVWTGGMWAQSFPQYQYRLCEGSDLVAICLKQAHRYYAFLFRQYGDDVRALAQEWACRPWVQRMTDPVEAFRDASRALYELARNLGWRKLTLKERLRLKLAADSAQWQRQERVEALRQKATLADPSGVGQYTRAAARGDAIHEVCCPQCHQVDCECQP